MSKRYGQGSFEMGLCSAAHGWQHRRNIHNGGIHLRDFRRDANGVSDAGS
jgi:hypothetical protein